MSEYPTQLTVSGEVCAFFRRGDDCGRPAKWSVLTPMMSMTPGGGWERPACGGHLSQAVTEAAERTAAGEVIEVRQL